jgi:hypothetical protein
MAIKTFTTGEVLTAADTNTYLANSGLVYIKSQTVGNGVSTVTVSDAFSATYDNYKITYTNGVGSVIAVLNVRLGSTALNYYNSGISIPFTGASSLQQTNNATIWAPVGVMGADYANLNIEMFSPFLSKKTFASWDYLYTAEYMRAGGYLNDTTSYTAFTVIPSGGTMTGGIITVYGYRKA